MSMDKAIASGHARRKPYYRGGKYDRTCRPGGSCPYCRGNRTIGNQRRMASARDQLREAVELREAAVAFCALGPVRDADDTAGLRATRNLQRAAIRFAKRVERS